MTAFAAVVAGLFGLAVGSFLNVVVHRLPRHESVVAPRSRCPGCATTIAARDNVPVLSWLLLRGHCRACGVPISWRYPAVEVATAGLFVAMGLRFGAVAVLPAYLVMSAALVAVAAIDAEHMVVPRRLVYLGVGLGVPLLAVGSVPAGSWHRVADGLLGGAVGFSFFFCVHMVSPRGMGFGDVRLAGLIGLYLGWLSLAHVAIGFFLAFLTGSLAGLALIATGRRRRDSKLPFAPFLALGALLAVLFGQPLRHLWLGG